MKSDVKAVMPEEPDHAALRMMRVAVPNRLSVAEARSMYHALRSYLLRPESP